MKVVFFGSSRYITPILETLHTGFDLSLAVTTEQGQMDPVPFFCKINKIEFTSVLKSADLISSYSAAHTGADVGVVADFGLIIPEQTLNFFPMGILNVHPSLLPKYRGASPVQNAILNGDKETGITIIKLDKYMDHGPVAAQIHEEIKPDDTARSLYERLFKLSAPLLQKILYRYETGQLKLFPQNHGNATFTKTLTRDDGFVDFKNFFIQKDFFERMVRAYYPWPGVWAKANVSDKKEDIKIVKFLPQQKIQVEGGREMSYKDFVNGYPLADKNLISFLKS